MPRGLPPLANLPSLRSGREECRLQAQPKPVPGQSALQWLLTQAPKAQRSRAEIDAELEAGRDGGSPCSMPRRRSI